MNYANQIAFGFVTALVLSLRAARADWTPPESSVTPPAVLTLDAFAELGTPGGKGAIPNGPLVVASDGNLYGSTRLGGTNFDGSTILVGGFGTLFRLTTTGKFTKLQDLGNAQGDPSALVPGPNGTLVCLALYGATQESADGGTESLLLRLSTNGTVDVYGDFLVPTDGDVLGLMLGPDDALYMPYARGYGLVPPAVYGIYPPAVYRVAPPDGTASTLYSFEFPGVGTNGTLPHSLVLGHDGAIYGVTLKGGPANKGTVFRLTTQGAFTNLHDFNGPDGSNPGGPILVGSDGALYGWTYYGGASNNGTLFRVTTGGSFAILHDFTSADDHQTSMYLVSGPDGALYGATYWGGTSNLGTLFRITTGGAFTKLHDFEGTDGANPSAAMMVGPDGALYGSTYSGGSSNLGTLFRLTTGGSFTKLHDFNGTNGSSPDSALVVGPDRALYGSTRTGGPHGGGILFKLVLERPPAVSIAHSNTFMIVTWPVTSLNLQLQENTDLSLSSSWSSVAEPAVTNAGQVSVTVSTTVGQKFFRLKSP